MSALRTIARTAAYALAGCVVAVIADRILGPVTPNDHELDGPSETPTAHTWDDLVACAGCGVIGRALSDETIIRAAGSTIPDTCHQGRVHGPWLPATDASTRH